MEFPPTTVNPDLARVLSPHLLELVRTTPELQPLPNAAQVRLSEALVDACCFACAGLPQLTNNGAKRGAWTTDIFVHDLCRILRAEGVHVAMNQNPEKSFVQRFAGAVLMKGAQIARGAGYRDFYDPGTLFKQMQRARKITPVQWPEQD